MAGDKDEPQVLGEKDLGRLKITVRLSSDRLSLFLDCELSKQGEKCKFARSLLTMMIKEIVGNSEIDFNTGSLDIIADNLNKDIPLINRKVAQGKAPVSGEDGRIELAVKPTDVIILAEGIKDTRVLRGVKSVEGGMILGKIFPPKEGTDGVDVLGQKIKAESGKAFKVNVDRTISVKPAYEDSGELVLSAQSAGLFCKDSDGKMRIVPDLSIAVDVDFTSGSVDHNGNVKIGGDVMKGFDVRARNNIYIAGRTHGGSLSSARGNVDVAGMVVGDASSAINVFGDLKAGMAQNINAVVVGTISILKDVRDSTLEAYCKVNMPQGYLLGGQVTSVYGIEANIIGSSGESNTVIVCLTNKWLQLALEKLNSEFEEVTVKEQEISSKLAPFAVSAEKLPVLSNANYLKINQAIAQLAELRVQMERLSKQIELFNLANSEQRIFRVNYKQTLHKGVRIKAGEHELLIDADRNGPGTVEYRLADEGFKEISYKPITVLTAKKEQ